MLEVPCVRLLFVEDSHFFVDAVRIVLSESTHLPIEFTICSTLNEALQCLEASQFDVVLLDLGLPDSSGLDTLLSIRPKAAALPIIVFTAIDDEQTAIESLKLGAQDYLLKHELNGRFLARSIHYSIERARNKALDAERLRLFEQRETLMAVITHDLKNPLIGANRVLGLLYDGALGALQPQQLDIIAKLKHGNDELLSMVRILLELYRFEHTNYVFDFQDLDLVPVVLKCVADTDSLASRNNVRLKTNLPPFLGAARADKDAVTHVLLNLLHNAIRFSPQGGEIELSGAIQADSVVVKVRDSGPGIPPEEVKELFTPSYRGTLGKEISVGTGLGLHLCQKILQAHDGIVTCSSRLSEGSTFALRLPLGSSSKDKVSRSAMDHSQFPCIQELLDC